VTNGDFINYFNYIHHEYLSNPLGVGRYVIDTYKPQTHLDAVLVNDGWNQYKNYPDSLLEPLLKLDSKNTGRFLFTSDNPIYPPWDTYYSNDQLKNLICQTSPKQLMCHRTRNLQKIYLVMIFDNIKKYLPFDIFKGLFWRLTNKSYQLMYIVDDKIHLLDVITHYYRCDYCRQHFRTLPTSGYSTFYCGKTMRDLFPWKFNLIEFKIIF